MGMESFFVKVYMQKKETENGNFINVSDIDWFSALSKFHNVEKYKDYIIIDNCIDFSVDRNDKEEYIVLIGCFSCYTYAVNTMKKIINSIINITNTDIKVFIYNKVIPYNEELLETSIYEGYSQKYEWFEKHMGIEKIVSPSKFYKRSRFLWW